MSILLSNECDVNGYAYSCSEHREDNHLPVESRRILVHAWFKDGRVETLKLLYNSQESLYNQMLVFVKSPLVDFSDRLRVKAFMGREYINYYEKHKVSKKRIVH